MVELFETFILEGRVLNDVTAKRTADSGGG